MDKFFSVLGKLVLIILIIGSVAYGSYYLGQKAKAKDTGTTYVAPTETSLLSPTLQLSPTALPKKVVLGGVDKKAGLSFTGYSLQVPSDWKESRESQTSADEKLTLEKEGYKISIFQAATGGAVCLYPGDPEFEGPSSTYTTFVNLKTKDGITLRRSGSNVPSKDGTTGFTMCQENTEGDFGQPTNYGHISISLPKGYQETTLFEMDEIITSLVKR